MLDQLTIIDAAIVVAACNAGVTPKKYLSLLGEYYTQGDLAMQLLNALDNEGYKIVKKD